MYPDVILRCSNLTGTSLNNLKVEALVIFCITESWKYFTTCIYSKMWIENFGLMETLWKSPNKTYLKRRFTAPTEKKKILCAHFKNAQQAWETQSLIVHVCFVIWCFILYRRLRTHQSTVCFVLWCNVLTHIPRTAIWELKNVEISCFSVLEHNKSRSNTDLWTSVLHWFLLPEDGF